MMRPFMSSLRTVTAAKRLFQSSAEILRFCVQALSQQAEPQYVLKVLAINSNALWCCHSISCDRPCSSCAADRWCLQVHTSLGAMLVVAS